MNLLVNENEGIADLTMLGYIIVCLANQRRNPKYVNSGCAQVALQSSGFPT